MPSTYTQNLGLEKPATGEQAGTWGVTANNSYDFIDVATDGNTSINLAGVGTQTSLATAQGTVSSGRNKLIIWTGAIAQTVTVDIAPASAQKLYVMRNETSGGFPLQFKQGAGGSIFTLQPLHDAWIYADGANTVGAALDDPQFKTVLVTGSLALGSDTGGSAMLGIADSLPASPSLVYRSAATVSLGMAGFELAIGGVWPIAWMQARSAGNTPAYLALNPLGGVVGIGTGTGVPQYALLEVAGNIRMSGVRTTLFYRGDNDTQRGGIQIVGLGTDGIVSLTPTDWVGNPISTAIHLGGFGNFNSNVVGLAVSGNVGIGGVYWPQDNLVIYGGLAYGQIRMAYGGYGAFFRNDGANFYLMITAPGDPFGTWTVPWPLQVDLGSHAVGIGGGPASGYALNVSGDCSVGGRINVSGDCSVGGRINMGGTVNASGYLLNGAPLSMQTPWDSDINAAGHSLNSVNVVTANSYRAGNSTGLSNSYVLVTGVVGAAIYRATLVFQGGILVNVY